MAWPSNHRPPPMLTHLFTPHWKRVPCASIEFWPTQTLGGINDGTLLEDQPRLTKCPRPHHTSSSRDSSWEARAIDELYYECLEVARTLLPVLLVLCVIDNKPPLVCVHAYRQTRLRERMDGADNYVTAKFIARFIATSRPIVRKILTRNSRVSARPLLLWPSCIPLLC